MRRLLFVAALALLIVFGCKSGTGSDPANLKPIQQQVVGAYTVSVFSETGTIKNGSSTYVLEFKKGDQLVDVGKVEVSPVMEMSGMAPMIGTAEVTTTATPGRYEVKSGLSMSGLWKVNVKFAGDQSVRLSLNAE
jgi:hypothetical protein